jgi:hypothetical protein
MNKRIQEIIEECGIVHEYQTVGEQNDILRRYEKLVEAIVKECADISIAIANGRPQEGSYYPAGAMYKRFGVK